MVTHKLGSIGRVTPSMATRIKLVRDTTATPSDPSAIQHGLATDETDESMHISMSAQAPQPRLDRQTVIRMSSTEAIESDLDADHVECSSDLFLG